MRGNIILEHYLDIDIVRIHYYIHINEDDFSFVRGCGCYTVDFCSPYGGVCDDDSFDWETLENKDFRNVCEDLLEQVNAYIKERELEDD